MLHEEGVSWGWGGLADLQAVDQISPLHLFKHLKVLAVSYINTAYAVSIFDRMMSLRPVSYPERSAYARFQQQGSCKCMLEHGAEALMVLHLAIWLGLDNATTYKYQLWT